jgi:Protein of unknown function (DUF1631)
MHTHNVTTMSQAPPRKFGLSDDPHGPRINLRQCLEAALHQSESLIDKALDGMQGKGKAAKGVGMQAKPNFSPAVQAMVELLSSQREVMKDSFNEHLRASVYEGVGVDAQSPQMMRFEDLKLFEEEDLDESIEVARTLQEICLLVDDVVPPLDALMSSLLGWITVQPQINPLRPEMYARALRECIAQQITDVEVRGTILSQMAGRMGTSLRRLYVELSSWLKSGGVESASALQPNQVQSSVAKPSVVGTMGNSVARTLLTLDRLRRLLSGELDTDARRPDFLHTVPASVVALQDMRQVEAMVQRLENKARKAAENPDADAARKKVAARLALADGKNLGKQLGEEVVRLMLDNLIQDERLLSGVRGHLQTLEPMLMDIAQVDGRFFTDKHHAARQFLDKVTNRSLGFATERDEGYSKFLKSIEKSIVSLGKKTSSGDDASQAFSEVLQSLEKAWERLDAEDRTRREEAARALMHAEQRNMLAQYLAQEFRANAEGVDVPSAVVDFVCGPWAQAVAEAQLGCTDGTSDPQGYHALVSELYWSVQPRVAKRNRKRLVQIIPDMLGKLRQGLHLIEFPPERITDFFTELISMHEAALEGGRPKPVVPAAASPELVQAAYQAEDEAALSDRAELEALYAAINEDKDTARDVARIIELSTEGSPEGKLEDSTLDAQEDFSPSKSPAVSGDRQDVWLAKREAQEAGFVEENAVLLLDATANKPVVKASVDQPVVVNAIPIGSWVEMMLETQWVRAQLTWASPHRTLFMFVSHGGKAHSMSQRTMDKLRSQNMIRVVSDGRLVDKALDAVAQTALHNSLVAGQEQPKT